MDSDTDESLNDFKTPKDFSMRNRQSHMDKGQTRKNAEKHLEETKSSNADSKIQSISSNLDQGKKTNEKVISMVKDNAGLSEEKKEFSRCPTCGKTFTIMEIIGHASACLKENFDVCRVYKKKTEKFCSDSSDELSNESFLCISCGCDLTSYSADQRNIHINKCLDSLKKVPTVKCQKLTEKKVTQSVNCPFCLKIVTQRTLKRHLVACQKKSKFSTMAAIALHRPGDEGVADELLAQIRESDNKPCTVPVDEKRRQRKDPRKQSVKKKRETYHDEMVQLAIAVSNNEDLEKKKPRVSKKKQEIFTPVMITLSPNSKRQQLEHRLHNIARSENFHGDDEIPSTPVLPTTSLTSSKVGLISSLLSRRPAATDDERPGTFGFDLRNMHSDHQPDEKVNVPSCCSSITHTEQSTSSTKSCHDVHQPEISSSDMKSSASFESIGNMVSSGLDNLNVQRNSSNIKHRSVDVSSQMALSRGLPLGTKWTLTKSLTPTRSQHHVPGLLSQFDGSRKKHKATLSEGDDELNSTLVALTALDDDCDELELHIRT